VVIRAGLEVAAPAGNRNKFGKILASHIMKTMMYAVSKCGTDGQEVLTVGNMKIAVFSDVTQYNPEKVLPPSSGYKNCQVCS
jgi:hypothetical protein